MKICDKLKAKVLCWLLITRKTCTPFLVLTKDSCATLGYHFTEDLAKLWAWQCFIDSSPLNSERLFRWSMRSGSWLPFGLAPPSVKWAIGITFLLSFVLYLSIVNFSEQEFCLFYRNVQEFSKKGPLILAGLHKDCSGLLEQIALIMSPLPHRQSVNLPSEDWESFC